jgi:hypothetical protein
MKASTHCIAALKLALGDWFQNSWNASLHGHLPNPVLQKFRRLQMSLYSAGSFRSSCSSRTRCAMLVLSSRLGGCGVGSSSRSLRLSQLKITFVPSIE